MSIYQKCVAAITSAAFAMPLFFGSLMADTTTTTTTNNEIPIPNGNQKLAGQTTVDAIVTDNQGNMQEVQLPYNSQTQSVTINNNQYGGDNASLFFPLFATGFMFYAGYWVGHDGSYWNGSHYTHVTNINNWNNHWNNYWKHDWAPKWNNYNHQHANDPGYKYHNNQQNWHDNAGHWNEGDRWQGHQGGEHGGQGGWRGGEGGHGGEGFGGGGGFNREGGGHSGGGGHR